MKRYIREVFIPEYAKNFNKELSASDIKFYGKIHFDRSRSNNELNMHCHLIVSRKDQTNKKKLSPLTNHKNTKNGVIKGGFDRVNLFQQAEQSFDRLFGYDRQQSESFDYHNTIKNGSISNQLKLQKQKIEYSERKTEIYQNSNRENLFSINLADKEVNNQPLNIDVHITTKQESYTSTNSSFNQENDPILSSLISFIPSGVSYPLILEEQNSVFSKMKKKKKSERYSLPI